MLPELTLGFGTVMAILAANGVRQYANENNGLVRMVYSVLLIGSAIGIALSTLVFIPLLHSAYGMPTGIAAAIIVAGVVGPIVLILHHINEYL